MGPALWMNRSSIPKVFAAAGDHLGGQLVVARDVPGVGEGLEGDLRELVRGIAEHGAQRLVERPRARSLPGITRVLGGRQLHRFTSSGARCLTGSPSPVNHRSAGPELERTGER